MRILHDNKWSICKVLLVGFVITSACWVTPAFSDILKIPSSCWPLELQARFKEGGRKLDLNAIERTKDSWGFIVSKGTSFELVTYQSTTDEDFAFIQKVVFEIEGTDG